MAPSSASPARSGYLRGERQTEGRRGGSGRGGGESRRELRPLPREECRSHSGEGSCRRGGGEGGCGHLCEEVLPPLGLVRDGAEGSRLFVSSASTSAGQAALGICLGVSAWLSMQNLRRCAERRGARKFSSRVGAFLGTWCDLTRRKSPHRGLGKEGHRSAALGPTRLSCPELPHLSALTSQPLLGPPERRLFLPVNLGQLVKRVKRSIAKYFKGLITKETLTESS